MKKPLLLLSLMLFALWQASAYKQESINITVNNKQRNMVVFTPNSLPASSPLFIVTHGMNQNPEYQYGSDKLYEMIDTAKFVVAYLRSDGSTWDTGGTNDQNFVIKTIDEMATRFDIDRNRVYWSGFSMGSMLIHHCIANMQDKIAAFAPTSGIQFSESPWNNCKKPVNLLECIAYDDDVFGYEQYGIHAYIENYAKHDKHTSYSKTVYRPGWYDGDLEKWTGGPNGGEVWLFSYHNGGHWPMTDNRNLIWNFCKRFSLNQPTAKITEPAGETTYLYMAPKGEAVFPNITVTGTGKVVDATMKKVEIFDGTTLIASGDTVPLQATIEVPKSGKHNLLVRVTDSKDKTGEGSCLVNYAAPTSAYSLASHFKSEGVVPQDWYVAYGSVKRAGGSKTYTAGPRILRFTNASKAFEYGLLVQNGSGKANGGWAKYGDKAARSAMTLAAGHYVVKYKVCNWNQPSFTPVTVAMETADGQEVASQVYTPTVNIGKDVSNKFTGVAQQTFAFDIPETGEYLLAFYAAASKNADFVLGSVTIQAKSFVSTGIKEIDNSKLKIENYRKDIYDLQGRRVEKEQMQRGLYIIDGRKVFVE